MPAAWAQILVAGCSAASGTAVSAPGHCHRRKTHSLASRWNFLFCFLSKWCPLLPTLGGTAEQSLTPLLSHLMPSWRAHGLRSSCPSSNGLVPSPALPALLHPAGAGHPSGLYSSLLPWLSGSYCDRAVKSSKSHSIPCSQDAGKAGEVMRLKRPQPRTCYTFTPH